MMEKESRRKPSGAVYTYLSSTKVSIPREFSGITMVVDVTWRYPFAYAMFKKYALSYEEECL